MTTTTWTPSPAGLLGLVGSAMRLCTDLDLRSVIGVNPAQVHGTGVPAGTAARLRPAVEAAFAHNSIGTTLGFHPSRRPQS